MDIVELAERTLVRHAIESVLNMIRLPKMEALSNARFGRGCTDLGAGQFVALSHEVGALPVIADLERVLFGNELSSFAMMVAALIRLVVAMARREISFEQYFRAIGILRSALGYRIVEIERLIHLADLDGDRFAARGHG